MTSRTRFATIIALSALAGCAGAQINPDMNVTSADRAACRYQAAAATAGMYDYGPFGIAGGIDMLARQGQLQRLCLEAAAASRPTIEPTALNVGRDMVGVPAYCYNATLSPEQAEQCGGR